MVAIVDQNSNVYGYGYFLFASVSNHSINNAWVIDSIIEDRRIARMARREDFGTLEHPMNQIRQRTQIGGGSRAAFYTYCRPSCTVRGSVITLQVMND
nr:hypothetical protein CFP56_73509 [Quercus suber]